MGPGETGDHRRRRSHSLARPPQTRTVQLDLRETTMRLNFEAAETLTLTFSLAGQGRGERNCKLDRLSVSPLPRCLGERIKVRGFGAAVAIASLTLSLALQTASAADDPEAAAKLDKAFATLATFKEGADASDINYLADAVVAAAKD